jgi:hypothetical protein
MHPTPLKIIYEIIKKPTQSSNYIYKLPDDKLTKSKYAVKTTIIHENIVSLLSMNTTRTYSFKTAPLTKISVSYAEGYTVCHW